MKPTVVEDLEAVIRKKICAACDVRTAEGACGLDEREGCSLFQLFPLVAQAVLATRSDNIDDYAAAIRENVCPVCVSQRLDGACELRDSARCALDLYLAPIVEAIQEFTQGRGLWPAPAVAPAPGRGEA